MRKPHMKIVSLVILIILLAILTVVLAAAAISNSRQGEPDFSGTFLCARCINGHLY